MKQTRIRALLGVIGSLAILQLGMFIGQVGPSRAVADPIGMSVTGGTNPLVSLYGAATSSRVTLYTVPSNRIFVITDIRASSLGTSATTTGTRFSLYNASSGRELWAGTTFYFNPTQGASLMTTPDASATFTTGLAVPASSVLQVSGTGVTYTITGYLARQ